MQSLSSLNETKYFKINLFLSIDNLKMIGASS